MKLMIDIAAEDFEKVKFGRGAVSMMRKAIIHGTPLPDGAEILTKEAYSDLCTRAAVESERKTGRWIKYGIPRCEEQHYQCTNCSYYINFGRWGELYTKEFKYCPSCGAKMDVEEE